MTRRLPKVRAPHPVAQLCRHIWSQGADRLHEVIALNRNNGTGQNPVDRTPGLSIWRCRAPIRRNLGPRTFERDGCYAASSHEEPRLGSGDSCWHISQKPTRSAPSTVVLTFEFPLRTVVSRAHRHGDAVRGRRGRPSSSRRQRSCRRCTETGSSSCSNMGVRR